MSKVLIIQNTISHYRVPVYNLIARIHDVTVMYSYGKDPIGAEFNTICIETHKVWRFIKHNKSIHKICKSFDVVILMMTPKWISLSSLLLIPNRKYKIISWGIGVPASYSVHFDDPRKISIGIDFMVKRSDAVVFYSDYPVKKYLNAGVSKEKMFVAHNTVKVIENTPTFVDKNIFLFIGSLYKAKGVQNLLDEYMKAYCANRFLPKLIIVGEGDEYEEIKTWIDEKLMNDNICLTGAIYDEGKLLELFKKAIICISPNQAGLSVQKSMGYAVPFVTRKDAFTGGEIFDINPGVNGVLLSNELQLSDVLIDAANNIKKYYEMGLKAKEFYDNNRTIEIMAQGVLDAISYVLGVK